MLRYGNAWDHVHIGEMAEVSEKDRERGQRMLRLRERLGVSQDALGDQMGQVRQQIIRAESGEHRLTSNKFRAAYAAAVGVTLGAITDYIEGSIGLDDLMRHASPADFSGGAESASVRTVAQTVDHGIDAVLAFYVDEPNRWSDSAIAAARAMGFKRAEAPTPKEWVTLLDTLERSISKAAATFEVSRAAMPAAASPERVDAIEKEMVAEENERRRSSRKRGK